MRSIMFRRHVLSISTFEVHLKSILGTDAVVIGWTFVHEGVQEGSEVFQVIGLQHQVQFAGPPERNGKADSHTGFDANLARPGALQGLRLYSNRPPARS